MLQTRNSSPSKTQNNMHRINTHFLILICYCCHHCLQDIINQNVQMSTENQNAQPIITTQEPFVVKIKLLSNEVYEITTSPNIPVTEFKKLVHAKTQVPVDRQRLVFSGKQLVDGTNISDYVKESGLTIHLIARSQPPPETPQNNQQNQPQQQQQPSQPQQVPPQFRPPPMPFPPGFNIFGMVNPQMATGNPQQQQNPNQFTQNINSAVNTLMGNLGIRLVPPPNGQNQPQPQQQQQQQQQPQTQPQQQRTSPPQPSQQPQQAHNPNPNPNIPQSNINQQLFRPLDQLEHSINRVNFPADHSHVNAHPRVNAINYLRRLQNNMLRFIPQLNRGIQMLQEGRTNHLPEFIDIFESLSASNTGAVDIIRNLTVNEQPHSHQHAHHHTHNHQCNHSHNHPQPQQKEQPNNIQMDVEQPEITATIVIAEDQNNGQVNVNVTTSTQNAQNQPNVFDTLSTFLQPGSGSGFNFANLFAQPPQPAQNTQPQPSQQPQQQPQQPFQQQSQNIQQANTQLEQPQQSQIQTQPQQQPQQQNPLGGLNIMNIFNNLQQSGGMGTLLGMSLGSMLEEEGQPTTVYSAILSPVTGSQILACFTQKDFSFIGRKREQFREATLKAISVAGSREELVNKYANDLEKMLMPEGSVNNEEICRKRVSKLLHKHIERVVGLFLNNPASESELTDSVMGQIKAMYCEAIQEISKHSESTENVFGSIKRGFVQSFEQMIPGFSGLLYSIIERDLVRVYREYITEKKRKQEMSAEEAQDEADLLKRIEEEAKEDAQGMASFEHSRFYPK